MQQNWNRETQKALVLSLPGRHLLLLLFRKLIKSLFKAKNLKYINKEQ